MMGPKALMLSLLNEGTIFEKSLHARARGGWSASRSGRRKSERTYRHGKVKLSTRMEAARVPEAGNTPVLTRMKPAPRESSQRVSESEGGRAGGTAHQLGKLRG